MIGLEKLQELGYAINNVIDKSEYNTLSITLCVNENDFKKMDEDLFYRTKQEGEFQPSDNEIHVNFSENFNVNILKKAEAN